MIIKRIVLKALAIARAVVNFFINDDPDLVWIKKECCSESSKQDIPKIIWMYWDSAEKNHLVDFCIYNTKKICLDYEVIVLNKNNVTEYLDLPVFKDSLQTAVIADYIRLSLLKKYGGIWMDASILLTENFDWFLSKMDGIENFVFYTDDCTTDINFPITENWFIAARKNSTFISDWLDEFKMCCLSDNPNNYYEKYEGNPIIQKIPNTDYLMCYISAAIVTSKKNYSVLYANSGAIGHYYNYRLEWFSFLIACKLFLSKKQKNYMPKMIKFTSRTRNYPNIFIRNNIFLSKSFFSTMLKKYYSSSSSTIDVKKM